MTDLEDLGLEDSPFSDFLGFELSPDYAAAIQRRTAG